jgi:hypothetical protein
MTQIIVIIQQRHFDLSILYQLLGPFLAIKADLLCIAVVHSDYTTLGYYINYGNRIVQDEKDVMDYFFVDAERLGFEKTIRVLRVDNPPFSYIKSGKFYGIDDQKFEIVLKKFNAKYQFVGMEALDPEGKCQNYACYFNIFSRNFNPNAFDVSPIRIPSNNFIPAYMAPLGHLTDLCDLVPSAASTENDFEFDLDNVLYISGAFLAIVLCVQLIFSRHIQGNLVLFMLFSIGSFPVRYMRVSGKVAITLVAVWFAYLWMMFSDELYARMTSVDYSSEPTNYTVSKIQKLKISADLQWNTMGNFLVYDEDTNRSIFDERKFVYSEMCSVTDFVTNLPGNIDSKTGRMVYHSVATSGHNFPAIYSFSAPSSVVRTFEKYFRYINEAGLENHWFKLLENQQERKLKRVELRTIDQLTGSLGLSDLSSAWFILAVGHVIAAIAFVLEILVHYSVKGFRYLVLLFCWYTNSHFY